MAEQSRFELLPQGSKTCVLTNYTIALKKHSQQTLPTESIEPKYQINGQSKHCSLWAHVLSFIN